MLACEFLIEIVHEEVLFRSKLEIIFTTGSREEE